LVRLAAWAASRHAPDFGRPYAPAILLFSREALRALRRTARRISAIAASSLTRFSSGTGGLGPALLVIRRLLKAILIAHRPILRRSLGA
jgi:hypothetical protein